MDAFEDTEGQDAIECKGLCSTWLHRKCEGLSKKGFEAVVNSSSLCKCPHFLLVSQEAEIALLKSSKDQLKSTVSKLLKEVKY